MKKTALALLAALAAPASPGPTTLAPVEPVVAAPAAAPLQQEELDRQQFLEKFRRAMEARSRTEMSGLVRRNTGTATVIILEMCEQIAKETNERLETEMEALRTAWRDAFSTDFADNVYEYFALMRVQLRAFRSQRKDEFLRFDREKQQAIEARNWALLDSVLEKFEGLADAFAQADDHYFVSECWWRIAQCWDDGVRGSDADYAKAGAAYRKSYEARERWDLKDKFFSAAKLRAEQLAGVAGRDDSSGSAGGDDTPRGGGGGKATPPGGRKLPGATVGEAVAYDLAFQLVEDIESLERPGYGSHELPTVWEVLNFQEPGTTAEFVTMENGPLMTRTGTGVSVDSDRDGTADAEIVLTGNVEAVEFPLGSGDEARRWGFLTIVLNAQEIYQGIGVPMQPQESYLGLRVAPAASMVGEVAGDEIQVFDDNMDGQYGSQPKLWWRLGLREGELQPIFDTMRVGRSKRAVPWSEYVELSSGWHQLRSEGSGVRVTAAPAELKTGTLKVDVKGATPEWLVVKGTGTFQYSYFDVMANGKKGIEVPAGSYELYVGEVRKGKRKQVMKSLILPGEGTKKWTVNPGETTKIELGAPYAFDFEAKDSSAEVTVVGGSVAIVGRGGEVYERFWNCVPRPDVSIRETGTKKRGFGDTMPVVLDFDTIFTKGFFTAWFPLDLSIKKKTSGDEVEIQLYEKKHDLFGEVETDWRAAKQ